MVAYETGVATSPSDLLGKLGVFVEANGWSYDPGSSGAVIYNGASGVGIFAGIFATATEIQTRGCLGYLGASAWNAQPGNSGVTHIIDMGAGPYTSYHIWVGDEDGQDYVHLTVEKTAGEFRHWALGKLVPYGSITGGVYCDSTFLSDNTSFRNQPDAAAHRHLCDANCNGTLGHVWVDYDGKINTWQRLQTAGTLTSTFHTGSTRTEGFYANFMNIGYQRWNFRTPQWPMVYFANRASSLRSPIGRMPNIRAINMRNFFPGQEVTISGDTWKIFPVFQKQTEVVANTIVSSGLYGYAHLMP